MKEYIIGLAVGIVIGTGILSFPIISSRNGVDSIEQQLRAIQTDIKQEAIFSIVADPVIVFDLLEDSPEWEEIDAVPYSRCFRHLIGTTTADYIVCKAI